MRRIHIVVLLSAIASPALSQTSAQTSVVPTSVSQLKARVAQTFAQAMPAEGRVVRVQSTVNYFVPGPNDSSDQGLAAQADARRHFYLQAGKECEVLMQTIAATCRLDHVNVNIQNMRYNPQQSDGFTLNGTMSFSITPK